MISFSNLGINTIHVEVDKIKKMGFKRAEICLGRGGTLESRIEKAEGEINYLEKNKIDYSIHLPLYLWDWFKGDYLDAFFLDKDEEKRKISIRLIEENLKILHKKNAEYYVIHFPGVYLNAYEKKDRFEEILEDSLSLLNKIASNYNVKILLEYFGSNVMFFDYRIWINKISMYSNLGILTDIGHLYYSSVINKFKFDIAIEELSKNSEAFHLWTTKGNEAYGENEFYKKYHHIAFNPNQRVEDGWAFDSKNVYKIISKEKKPMVIEASTLYCGEKYFYDSIEALIDFDSKIMNLK